MNETHRATLQHCINEIIAMERDIINAVTLQIEDPQISVFRELRPILQDIVHRGDLRIGLLKQITEHDGSSFGSAIKEGVTSITGTLAGLYGRIRDHPVSRMIRDDIIALQVATTSYGMLLTLALGIGHRKSTDVASLGLKTCPSLLVGLSDLLPAVVFSELAHDAPLPNPEAAHAAMSESMRKRAKKCHGIDLSKGTNMTMENSFF